MRGPDPGSSPATPEINQPVGLNVGNRNTGKSVFRFIEILHVLLGWLSHSIRYPANQNAFLKVKHFCFYVKVAYHFRPEYNYDVFT